ncbi:MAG: hypothetical protein LRZ84_14805 [Desertifilum sp.]|nr:hypothetical protein [Desertifilum sp.]
MQEEFPINAVTALPTFYRTYSRVIGSSRESWQDVCDRTIYNPESGLAVVGKLTPEESHLIYNEQLNLRAVSSGRWLWCGGTQWLTDPKNWHGAFNCSSTQVEELKDFGRLMNLAMQGVGTGAVLTQTAISKLPSVANRITIVQGYAAIGTLPKDQRFEHTKILPITYEDRLAYILMVGDSREGWVEAYQFMIDQAFSPDNPHKFCQLVIDVSGVRPNGEPLKGFGGIANPTILPELFTRVAELLNDAKGRQLNSLECCLLIDEAARIVVAGNLRRSAGMRQFDCTDELGATAKLNLWEHTADGRWIIDPKRQPLTLANHTRVFWRTPSFKDIHEAVTLQFKCGEGAIMYAPEALWRANKDLFPDELHADFLQRCEMGTVREFISSNYPSITEAELDNRVSRIGLNPCGEEFFRDNHCNLYQVHADQLDPFKVNLQSRAFIAATLGGCALLHRGFQDEKYQRSREFDPRVQITITGLFDFFCENVWGGVVGMVG